MTKSMTLTSRMGEGDSCASYPSWVRLSLGRGPSGARQSRSGLQGGSSYIHGGSVLRRGSAPLCLPRHYTWSWVSSRVQGPSCKALLEERGP